MKKVNPIYLWCRRGSASNVFKRYGGITGAICSISVFFSSDLISFTMAPIIFLSNSEGFFGFSPSKHSFGEFLSYLLISVLYHIGVGILAGWIGYILWYLYKYLKSAKNKIDRINFCKSHKKAKEKEVCLFLGLGWLVIFAIMIITYSKTRMLW